jgi:rhodanese-related sulfurtransferase
MELDYAGDLDSQQTWDLLKKEKDSFLVDCRSNAEWSFVGVPDLESLQKNVIFVEWQTYPRMEKNERFLEEISQTEIKKNSKVIFLCRSGARSRSAAELLTLHGYKHCFNCCNGFEGNHNQNGHRGTVNGWQFSKLPWKQG